VSGASGASGVVATRVQLRVFSESSFSLAG
jgi:hypothetical protein